MRHLASVAPPGGSANRGGGDGETLLYEVRQKIYPRAVHGWFAGWRVTLVLATQLIFYGLPWLTWNARPAMLFDLGARKFYVFGWVLWPQDFIFLTGLLVVSALSLFLFTAVAGRLFCGYACPQTVYTEMFMWIERMVEGDRMHRMRLDRGPASAARLARKALKHGLWIGIALWTGFTFVGYFTPIRVLMTEVVTAALGSWETFWILFYSLATYGNAGWMREQVCKYMCPYARFQSAMFDRDTLVITYDTSHGEPRGARSRSANRAKLGVGDCVDCGICVQVCPTGIDIRKGLQYECIGCAACIDGCNQVMDKMGYTRGLIRYSTLNAVAAKWDAWGMWRRVLRARTLIYGALLLAIIGVLLGALYLRTPLKVDVIRDRAALARETRDGMIENVYRLQIMNTGERARRFTIRAIPETGGGPLQVIAVQPVAIAGVTTMAVTVTLRAHPADFKPGSYTIRFHVEDADDSALKVDEKSRFYMK
jgi:cytochrome c oxidase accessory protein FixG